MKYCCGHHMPHRHARAYVYDTSRPGYYNAYGAYMQASAAWLPLMKVLYEFGIVVHY